MPPHALGTYFDELLLGPDFLLRRTATPFQGFHLRLQFFRTVVDGLSAICSESQIRVGGIKALVCSASRRYLRVNVVVDDDPFVPSHSVP